MKSPETFYTLGSPRLLRAGRAASSVYGSIDWYSKFKEAEDRGISFEPVYCSLDPRHRRGGERIGTMQLILPVARPGDFTWTWIGPVVTDRVLSLFKDASFTGFKINPATILKSKRGINSEASLPKIWELEVVGKGGEAHPDSGIRLLYSCPQCGYERYSSFHEGIKVDQEKWDGSDFFTVTGYPTIILVRERVKRLVMDNSLSNCAIIRSEDLRWGDNIPRPEDHPENFIPGKIEVLRSTKSSTV